MVPKHARCHQEGKKGGCHAPHHPALHLSSPNGLRGEKKKGDQLSATRNHSAQIRHHDGRKRAIQPAPRKTVFYSVQKKKGEKTGEHVKKVLREEDQGE